MGILEEDFSEILKIMNLGEFEKSSILVTGATGLIGSNLVKLLHYINKQNNLNIKILAAVRRQERAELILEDVDCEIICCDICRTLLEEIRPDYIFHCAAVTQSMQMISQPVETADVILKGTENMLKLALEKKVKGIVYFSSMEVYGSPLQDKEWCTERELGNIELFSARSCYPMAKRMAEHMCYIYNKEYGVPVKIARLAQTFGPGILPGETRIFGQLARCVILKQDIILHTAGVSSGNYCYLADCLCGVITIMLKGNNGEVYNVVNEECCTTIRAMAEMVANEVAGGEVKVIIHESDAAAQAYPVPVKLKLSSQKLAGLGWRPHWNLKDMYVRMIAYIKENNVLQ